MAFATGNETIGMLKTTSLVTAVPFTLELQFATNAIANRIYNPAAPPYPLPAEAVRR